MSTILEAMVKEFPNIKFRTTGIHPRGVVLEIEIIIDDEGFIVYSPPQGFEDGSQIEGSSGTSLHEAFSRFADELLYPWINDSSKQMKNICDLHGVSEDMKGKTVYCIGCRLLEHSYDKGFECMWSEWRK